MTHLSINEQNPNNVGKKYFWGNVLDRDTQTLTLCVS